MPEEDPKRTSAVPVPISDQTIIRGGAPDIVNPLLGHTSAARPHDANDKRTQVAVHAVAPVSGLEDACLVLFYPAGPEMGKRFPLSRIETVLGRGADCDILIDRDSVSRRHARVFRTDARWFIEDLQSTNGSYVNDVPVTKSVLRDSDYVKIGAAIFKFLSGSSIENSYHEAIYNLTIVDALTSAHNKRYLLEFLDREVARCVHQQRPLSLLLLDIDHFNQINDKHGHLTGDHVLREMSKRLLGRVRREELLARYGGEEFAIVLPDTDLKAAHTFGEKIRAEIGDMRFEYEGDTFPVTVSVGVATLEGEDLAVTTFIKIAADNVFRAKRQGRNRVVSGRENWPRWKPDPNFALQNTVGSVGAVSLLGRQRLLANTGGAARVDDLEGLLYTRLSQEQPSGSASLTFGVVEGVLLVGTAARSGRNALRARVLEAVQACAEEQAEARFATSPVCVGPTAVAEAISGLEDELEVLENGRYLPQPIALAARALETKGSTVAQAKYVLELGESVLQWLALCASAELLHQGRAPSETALQGLSGPVSMGRWHEILSSAVKDLAKVEAVHAGVWRATFGNKAERSAVLSWFNDLTALRNNFSHDPTANDEHVVREIVDKRGPHLRQLVRQELRPVLSLIPAEVEFVDFEDELQCYRVTRLVGERSPVAVPFYSRRKMKRGLWLCDLIADRAVPLEPLFVRDTCPKCGARELFLLHRLDELSFRNPFSGHVLEKRLDQLPFRDDDKETLEQLRA